MRFFADTLSESANEHLGRQAIFLGEFLLASAALSRAPGTRRERRFREQRLSRIGDQEPGA